LSTITHYFLNPQYQKMPLQHVVTFQAFQEITNFIRNNDDDWEEFYTNTARSTRKAKKTPVVSNTVPSKHKTAENEGRFTIEPLLKENPHRFVLFPIQHADIWQMYKKAEASF
jgi:ribonucleoside-diphosphate reductase subunit M2